MTPPAPSPAAARLVVLGPTAVGKTSLILSAAQRLSQPIEVVSADSRQLYRGLSIGTAKPTASERSQLPHHLVDIIDPDEPYSAARFAADGQLAIQDIAGRGAVPVVVGGTGFYLRAILYGMSGAPPSDPEVRERLEARCAASGLAPLRDELERVDPESANAIGPNDAFRVIRALEIYYITGTPRSAFAPPRSMKPGYHDRVIGLRRDRDELYERINRRVSAMMAAGLAAEVEALVARGYAADAPGMRTIGYREFFAVGGTPPWSDSDLTAISEQIARSTRVYARRQETFFRALKPVHWFHADDPAAIDFVVDAVGNA